MSQVVSLEVFLVVFNVFLHDFHGSLEGFSGVPALITFVF